MPFAPTTIDSGTVAPAGGPVTRGEIDSCDHCGSMSLEWRKCKLVCLACRQIVKSCADL